MLISRSPTLVIFKSLGPFGRGGIAGPKSPVPTRRHGDTGKTKRPLKSRTRWARKNSVTVHEPDLDFARLAAVPHDIGLPTPTPIQISHSHDAYRRPDGNEVAPLINDVPRPTSRWPSMYQT